LILPQGASVTLKFFVVLSSSPAYENISRTIIPFTRSCRLFTLTPTSLTRGFLFPSSPSSRPFTRRFCYFQRLDQVLIYGFCPKPPRRLAGTRIQPRPSPHCSCQLHSIR